MKTIISLAIFVMTLVSFNTTAQMSNFVGKWETTTPVSFYNNSVMRIKISDIDVSNYLIITNADTPKKKIGSKYDPNTNRLYTTVKGHQIYFVYDPLTDMLEVFKINDASICLMTRFQ
jgi:hypothetical protein